MTGDDLPAAARPSAENIGPGAGVMQRSGPDSGATPVERWAVFWAWQAGRPFY